MRKKFIFSACLLVTTGCLSQTAEPVTNGTTVQYPFVHYTPREGLANNRARFTFQDSKGKLYIGTYAGLSIYDGTRFVNYNTNNGLESDLINDVEEMGDDSLLVIPNANKIHWLIRGKLKDFVPADHFTPLVNQLTRCSNGFYYAIADEGLFRLENNRFIKLPFEGIPEDEAKTFLQVAEIDKKLYLLSNPDYKSTLSNLLVYDLSLNKVVGYNKDIRGITLFQPSPDELWISTGTGMFMLDRKSDPKNVLALTALPDSFHIPKNLFPHGLYRDREHNIWIACTKGVYRIRENGDTTLFTTENGLTTNFQTGIFQDFEHNLWLTNEQTGLTKLSNEGMIYYPVFKAGFTPTDISIRPFSDSVWIYDCYHRIILLVPPPGQHQAGQMEKYNIKDSIFSYSKFVSANEEYILSAQTIFRWHANPANKQSSLSVVFYDSTNPQYGFTRGTSDKNGNLVAVSNKLILLAGNKVMSEPVSYMADQLAVDNKNRVWVATRSNQLFCFQISGSGAHSKLSLLRSFDKIVPGSPRSVIVDKSGNIWIGTRNNGVYCIHFNDLSVQSVRQLTSQNGLSENFISYLFCDNDNNIWACSPSGLDRIQTAGDHFFVENITRSSNLYIPVLKVQQTASGVFWILTNSGIITYRPFRREKHDPITASNHRDGWKPQLLFSDVVISNARRKVLPAGGKLKYFQNNLVFHLSAPSYIDEKQTRFSYQLEGSGNENWSEPSADASINFVNLPPGEYTLRAKAIFLHGRYPDTESTFSFTILPPWWQTWWFRMIAALLIIALLILAFRSYYRRQLEKQMAFLERRRAVEKERTRIATDMHDDLGAGLSQIKFLSETIGMKKQKHLPFEEEIDSIRSFSDEMIDKMGEIVWALNEKNDTLSDLLSYTRSYAMEYLEQNGIACTVDEPDAIPQDYVSSEFRRNIYLTVKETLHNVVKHAQASEVSVKIEIDRNLTIQIRDNGIGITVPPGKASGNGLINMNKRIKELNGSFEIMNNNGTVVTIRVPLN